VRNDNDFRRKMKIDILTLFPEMFDAVMGNSILGRAAEKNILDITTFNIRDYTIDKHKKVDEYPFGGGVGMVMAVDPIFRTMEAISAQGKKIIYLSPRGKILDKDKIEGLAKEKELVVLCGHYEGVDQRIIDYWDMEEISIGDYILTGGELPAMVLIDAVARMLPGVLGSEHSAMDESVYSGLLEYPQYTKPRSYRGMDVPEVLLGGNHRSIYLWKFEEALQLTKERRPDLFNTFMLKREELSKDEKKILDKIK
jgi:tRNA (guanine37-N1)-methyltransferase